MTSTDDPLRPKIEFHGQAYYDEPVFAEPRRLSEIEYAVGRCFNSARQMAARIPPRLHVAWQQVKLNWINARPAKAANRRSFASPIL